MHLCISHIWAQMGRIAFLLLEGKDIWFGLPERPSDT